MNATIQKKLTETYLSALLGSQKGRVHLLNQCAEAEASDEGQIFEVLATRVGDPELQRMVRKHQEDELRHAEMFRACVVRNGGTPHSVPAELQLIDRLDKALGGVMALGIADDRGVMEAYVLLQVIEERAITQFQMFEPHLRKVDPQSADVFAAIAKDEERHLRYCHAISKRYAPSEAVREWTLRRYREVEAKAFAANSAANMRYSLTHGLLDANAVERLGWWGVLALTEITGRDERTVYWEEPAPKTATVRRSVVDDVIVPAASL